MIERMSFPVLTYSYGHFLASRPQIHGARASLSLSVWTAGWSYSPFLHLFVFFFFHIADLLPYDLPPIAPQSQYEMGGASFRRC